MAVRRFPERRPVRAVELPKQGVVVPEDCACCGAPGAKVLAAHRWLGGSGLLVPYCPVCHRHASAESTAELSLVWSTALIALTALLGVPLVLGSPSVLVVGLAVLLASAVPSLGFLLWPRRIAEGHATSGHAATFRGRVLLCRNPGWGQRLAESNSAASSVRRVWSPAVPAHVLVVCGLAALATAPVLDVLFPVVHVVTGGTESLRILVDGKERTIVAPSGSEYASSLQAFRVLVGPRHFVAIRVDGKEADPVSFEVTKDRDYLYAPDSRGTCFRIEEVGYGRDGSRKATTLLDPERAFWEIEPRVDLWFSPLPGASPDRRSSGGSARSLRRASCEKPGGGGKPLEPGFETPDEG